MAVLCCMDCGLPYNNFGLDLTLPDADWRRINNGSSSGVLCARCIVWRAAADDGVAVRAYIDRGNSTTPSDVVTVPREAVVYIKTNHYRGVSVNVANVFGDEKSAIEQVEKWHGGCQHYHDSRRPELCDWCKSIWRRVGNSLIRTVNHDGAVVDYELRTMPLLDAALTDAKDKP